MKWRWYGDGDECGDGHATTIGAYLANQIYRRALASSPVPRTYGWYELRIGQYTYTLQTYRSLAQESNT